MNISNRYNLDKLNSYKLLPRSTDSQFFKDFAGKPPFFGKDKWSQKYASAPLLYAAVVQAN